MIAKPKRVMKISDLPGYVKKQPEPKRFYKPPIKKIIQPCPEADVNPAIQKLRQIVRPLEPHQPKKGTAFLQKRLDNIVNFYMLRAIDANIDLNRPFQDEQKDFLYKPVYRPAQPRPVALAPVVPKVIQTPIVSRQIGGVGAKPSGIPSSAESTPSKEKPKKVVRKPKKQEEKKESVVVEEE